MVIIRGEVRRQERSWRGVEGWVRRSAGRGIRGAGEPLRVAFQVAA